MYGIKFGPNVTHLTLVFHPGTCFLNNTAESVCEPSEWNADEGLIGLAIMLVPQFSAFTAFALVI